MGIFPSELSSVIMSIFPLGGNRKGPRRRTINLLIVWSLTGFWHGASWNFIFWGLYFFLFIYMENTFLLEKLSRLPRFVSHLYAMIVVYFGWVLFRCESLGNLGTILKGMFGLNHNGFSRSFDLRSFPEQSVSADFLYYRFHTVTEKYRHLYQTP
mgnify:CR=1 FL=1